MYANDLTVFWGIRQDNQAVYQVQAANRFQPNVDRLWSLVFTNQGTNGTFVIYLNGAQVGTPRAAASRLVGRAPNRIGYAVSGNAPSTSYVGRIREFAAYTGDMSNTTRQQIEAFLINKWNITSNLPTTTVAPTTRAPTTTVAPTTTRAGTTTLPPYLYAEVQEGPPKKIIGFIGGNPATSRTFPPIPPSIIEIAPSAFYKHTNLTGTLTIPRTLKKIGGSAFAGTGISGSLFIPSTLKYIGEGAFFDNGLTEITIESNGISTINKFAFGANALRTLILPSTVTSIETGAFIFNNLSTITMGAATRVEKGEAVDVRPFSQNPTPLKITVTPSTAYLFSDPAFTTIAGLRDVPNLDRDPFNPYASAVTLPPFPTYARKIGVSAFMNYPIVNELNQDETDYLPLTIPSTITELGNYAFANCVEIQKISLPPTLSTIGEYAFAGCVGIFEIALPSTLRSVKEGAFYGCLNIQNPIFPPSVIEIQENAFTTALNINELNLPPSLSSIGARAFEGALALYSLTIPPSVTHIGEEAFSGSTNLEVTYSGTTKVGKDAFKLCKKVNVI